MTVDAGIYRSRNSRWIRGVCAGINPLWIRLTWILGSLTTGLGISISIGLYIVLGFILPESDVF